MPTSRCRPRVPRCAEPTGRQVPGRRPDTRTVARFGQLQTLWQYGRERLTGRRSRRRCRRPHHPERTRSPPGRRTRPPGQAAARLGTLGLRSPKPASRTGYGSAIECEVPRSTLAARTRTRISSSGIAGLVISPSRVRTRGRCRTRPGRPPYRCRSDRPGCRRGHRAVPAGRRAERRLAYRDAAAPDHGRESGRDDRGRHHGVSLTRFVGSTLLEKGARHRPRLAAQTCTGRRGRLQAEYSPDRKALLRRTVSHLSGSPPAHIVSDAGARTRARSAAT